MKDLAIRLEENRPWIKTKADEAAVRNGCWFDVQAAKHVCDFYESFLRHSKGKQWARQRFELLPWERDDVLYPIFGWKRADGTRRYRTAYIEIAKKNGKTTLASGIGLYLLVGDGEPGAEVYSVATKRDQAAMAHDEAVRMVRQSPALFKRLRINETTKTIYHEDSSSKYAALAADAKGSEGLNAHGLIVDELHAWTDRTFWDSLRYSGAARKQPLHFIITTAGIADTTSLGWQMHDYAEKVLEGTTEDEEFFVYMRNAPFDAPWTAETFEAANPSYGTIIDPEEIAKAAETASERLWEENVFRRYRLNQWVQQAERAIDLVQWDTCAGDVVEDDLVGRPCYGGLDLASRIDLAAFILLFPPAREGDRWQILCRFWAPEAIAEKRAKQKLTVQFKVWAKQGHLVLTSGNIIDYDTIKAKILADGKRFDIRLIAADRWNLEYLRQKLEARGCPEIIECGQGYPDMSAPTKELLCMIAAQQLAHGGHPVLRWMAGNVTVTIDPAENIKPDRKKSTDKIDGIVALLMALKHAMANQQLKQYTIAELKTV